MARHAVWQVNLNRCWEAHHLLTAHVKEHRVALCAISEPPRVREAGNYITSHNGLAAILAGPGASALGIWEIYRGRRFVAAKMGNFSLVSCYISSNVGINDFLMLLDQLEDYVLRLRGTRIVVCGDFNAHSGFWGDRRTDRRGVLLVLTEWAARLELDLVNVGSVPTCVRFQEESVIDLTWSSREVGGSITDWRVRSETETLSDHLAISFLLGERGPRVDTRRTSRSVRWKFDKMDVELFREVVDLYCEAGMPPDALLTEEGPSDWLMKLMKGACGLSTPKSRGAPGKKQNYWWNEELGNLRLLCISARRR